MSTCPASLDLSGLNLVVGLGASGLSVLRALRALGAEVEVTDSRTAPPGLAELAAGHPEVAFHAGFDRAPFERAARLIVSPGVAVATPEIAAVAARGVPVWGDIELFARLTRVPVAAITGANGKSTVTTLLGQMAERAGLKVAVGGNLGIPALELWLQHEWNPSPLTPHPVPDLYVLELSSFQLETTASLDAAVATVLNVTPDHMDRYATFEDYAAAKARVFRGSGAMVLNADDPVVMAMAESGRRTLRFGLEREAEYRLRDREGRSFLACGRMPLLETVELRVGGAHNRANALAALALGTALGLPMAAMLATLRDFAGLAHRTQLIVEHRGVAFYDDSKGTNVGATVAAVRGLPGRLVLIAGGEGKGQDFGPLRQALAGKARAVVLIGRDAPLIAAALEGAVPLVFATDMAAAVALAFAHAEPGDAVLLSPACASFDMFSGYAERGRVFGEAARRLAAC